MLSICAYDVDGVDGVDDLNDAFNEYDVCDGYGVHAEYVVVGVLDVVVAHDGTLWLCFSWCVCYA